ncbi:hypothetical protein [Megasphaera sp. DJF_B143]|nr:hypothetical protein [Megasphaera sp. DJF_B143]
MAQVSAVMVDSWAQGVSRQVTMPTRLLSGRSRDSYFHDVTPMV